MNLNKFGIRAKRVLAFVLAFALFFSGWANYDFSVFAADELEVTLDVTEAVYTGKDLKPGMSVSDGVGIVPISDENITWTNANNEVVNGSIIDAGVYTATVVVKTEVLDAEGEPTGEMNERSGSAQFTVKPLDITGFAVNVAGSYTYTGTAIVPADTDITVTSETTTVDKSLYTVEVTNNENATDTPIVTVKAVDGNKNVTGTTTGTFVINPVVFDIVWNLKDYVFDDSTNHFPTATVNGVMVEKRNEAVSIVNGVSVTLSTEVDTTVNPGKYTAAITLNDTSGNYKLADGKATCEYNVAKKKLNDGDVNVLVPASAEANGERHVPEVTVTVGDKTLVADKDYTVTMPAEMITTGTYNIKVSGMGNYEGEVNKTFEIVFTNDANAKAEVNGNTFRNNVYKGEITVSPAPGYGISVAEDGTYGENLKYDTTSVIPEKLYLKNLTNGKISEVAFPVEGLSFDDTDPTLAVTAPDADVWASSKIVDIKADGTGSECSVYYAVGERINLTSPVNEKTDLGNLKFLSGNLTIEENISEEVEYYFYAIDAAGNVVISDAVVVNKVDVDKPVTTIDPENRVSNKKDSNGVYWKDAEDFVIPILIEDNLSGIKEVKVTGSANLDCQITDGNKLKADATITITEPGTYTITVTDEAGLSAVEQTFVVEADTKAPEITLDKDNLSGTNKYHDTADVYWFSEKQVKLPFTVENITGETPNETLSTYKVVYSTDADFANKEEVEVAEDKGTAVIEIAESEKAITYYFKTVDFAGNEGAVQSVQLAYDDSDPEIAEVKLTQLDSTDAANNSEWINGNDRIGDLENGSKVSFEVTVDDSQTGIQKIEYSADGGKTYHTATVEEKAGVYTFVTNEAYKDGADYNWQVKVTNNVNVSVDTAIAAGLGKIDVTAPESEAYIQFFADVVGSNDISEGVGKTDGKGNWASDILSMAGNAWNKIWGRTKISFEVYVKDETSGIAGPESVVMTYKESGSNKVETITLGRVSGVQAFDAEDIKKSNDLEGSGYSIFTGSIEIREDKIVTLSANDFKIESITDIAGNVTENIVLNSAADGDIIYIDAETPKLVSVSYTDESGNAINPVDVEGNRDFYKETVYATVKLKERFFGEDGKYPVIVLNKTYFTEDGACFTDSETIDSGNWEYVAGSEYTYAYKVSAADLEGLKLDLQSGQEVKYNFTISYTDPSGNILTAATGVSGVESGKYTSREIVIDNLAPKLESYEINDPTAYKFNEAAIYKNVAGSDLKIEFKVNDNPDYYEKLSKDNLVAKIYIDGKEEPLVATLSEIGKSGRIHTFAAEYDGDDTIENIVYVELAYADEVGNALVNSDDELKAVEGKSGTYRSADYVIDHVAPELTSVKIGDNDVVATPGEEDGGKYFYKETQELKLTIDERFFAVTDNTPEVILKSRTDVTADFTGKTYDAEWAEDADGNWSTTVVLEETDSNECEYQVEMKYTDASGNKLTGNGVNENGTFVSQIFVVEKVAPKIVSYEVTKTTECVVDEAEVRKNVSDDDDLVVRFTLDDNESYYDLSKGNLVVKLFNDDTNDAVLTLKDVEEKNLANNEGLLTVEKIEGRERTYSFCYDGDTSTENKFHVEISYRDKAGNALVLEAGTENILTAVNVTDDNDTYKSGQYIIDHVAPKFNITYSDAVNVVTGSGENAKGKTPLKDCTAYYNSDIKVVITFEEKYANSLEHFEIVGIKDSENFEIQYEISPMRLDNFYKVEFTIKADEKHKNDGDYQFIINYSDCAENLMEIESVATSSNETEDKGVYESPVLVIDTTAPVVNTRYIKRGTDTEVQPVQSPVNGRDYFNNTDTVFEVEVIDRSIRDKELKEFLTGMEAYGYDTGKVTENENSEGSIKKITGTDLHKYIENMNADAVKHVDGSEKDKEKYTKIYNLPLVTESNYIIPVDFTDLAGNRAEVNGVANTYTELVTVDTTTPDFELTYEVEGLTFANYWEYGCWFKKAKIVITLTAKDAIAGVEWIQFTVTDEAGKITQRNLQYPKPAGSRKWIVEVPIDDVNDFKGSVYAKVIDYSTNSSDEIRGYIVESKAKHSETGKAEIETITSPSRTVAGVAFYNTDVKFKLTLEDSYSGLASWVYKAGKHPEQEMDYKNAVGSSLTEKPDKDKDQIIYKYTEVVTIDSTLNNENDVLVTASYIDNVGYDDMEVEETYNIDITKPIITVEYDLNNPANGKYYNEVRTATVKIRERNFDAGDVEFLITSTDGPNPQISSWSHSGSGDDTVHTCTVTFNQDSDYTFTVKFMDMAGNVADYDRVDEFTIDLTDPVATITYDNNDYLNEYYYDAARTATIDILEHNFDPTAIEIMVTADGSTAGVPHISAWSHNGDHNIATITFSADAEYTFDIAGVDLALNELEDYTPDHFVVDQTAPELEIFDIEHMSANNGVVRPGIRYYDTNYDKDGTVILMTGYQNGIVEMTGDRKLEANGLELKLNDFAYVQEMDDIYTMEATVYDLAGNSSEAMVMFSVNRFGSVYTFDEATEALIGVNGSYYTKEAQDIVITETNVDTLVFKEITMNLNGKLTTLKEGKDYTVKASGTEATWKQYTYHINAANFTEEGTYILTIYSEDKATNTSDNNTKNKKVEFVVDKTSPSVLISGIETDGEYRTDVQNMIIDIDDNVIVSSVKVIIDGVETIFDGTQIVEADGKLEVGVSAKNYAQNIQVIVTDAAGNEVAQEITNVRVNANVFVLFYLNKPLFFGTIGGGAVTAGLLWWFLVGKKKKGEEQTQAK